MALEVGEHTIDLVVNVTKRETNMERLDIDLIFAGVGVKDVDACVKWAFPDITDNTLLSVLDYMWNKYHSDLFFIGGDDNVRLSIEKIGRKYIELHEGKNAKN